MKLTRQERKTEDTAGCEFRYTVYRDSVGKRLYISATGKRAATLAQLKRMMAE